MENVEVKQEKPEPARTDRRTEEVQHIIDRMPVTFFSRVAMLLAFTVIALLVMGWVVRYPDVVTGQLVVNSSYASLKLVANTNGRLKLNARSMATVEEGDYIAYLHNTANIEDVKAVNKVLASFDMTGALSALKRMRAAFPQQHSLGELNARYYSFVSGVQDVIAFREDSLYNAQQQSLQLLLLEQHHMQENTQHKLRLGHDNLKVVQSFLSRDSLLFAEKVISKADFDRTQMSYFSAQSSTQQLNNEVISIRKDMQHIQTQMHEMALQHQEKEKQLMINLLGLYNELKADITAWEEKYVFKAPIGGKVQYLEFWTDNQFISAGAPVFSIVPQEQRIIGQVYLPAVGAGKVEAGQEVIIKLDNYPFMEYGTIKGTVTNVSLMTNTMKSENGNVESYLVSVDLPRQLKTNYGTDLGFKFELRGTAEIITHDRRLMERLFDNLRYFTKN
jgi:hypothetical protein